jgi:hypothetical protein
MGVHTQTKKKQYDKEVLRVSGSCKIKGDRFCLPWEHKFKPETVIAKITVLTSQTACEGEVMRGGGGSHGPK